MLGIIDDPLKNWEEAQSALRRQRKWEWYRATFRTRIWEGGAIVIICTRWHEDDLVGRLLAASGGADSSDGSGQAALPWTVLRLPALAEPQEIRDDNDRRCGLPGGQPDPLGRPSREPLCPDRFSLEALAAIRRRWDTWPGRPNTRALLGAPEGNTFRPAWLPVVDEPPELSRQARYWDRAATAGGGCATAGVLMGYDADGGI